MPHDRKGNVLKNGDKVMIPATIISTPEFDGEYCNCTVQFDECMPPYAHRDTLSSINTKQLEKIIIPDEV